MLTPEQQERYSRHLLLDGFDQDRLRAASFHVVGRGREALWAARYLAASGCGRLQVDEAAWLDELRRLGPWTGLSPGVVGEKKIIFFPVPGKGSEGGEAVRGAMAALEAVREVAAR